MKVGTASLSLFIGCTKVALRPPELDSFFFKDTATTDIYTLSLHDALPIFSAIATARTSALLAAHAPPPAALTSGLDRKSTRLNSSHGYISYAVFCLKKKKKNSSTTQLRTQVTETIN